MKKVRKTKDLQQEQIEKDQKPQVLATIRLKEVDLERSMEQNRQFAKVSGGEENNSKDGSAGLFISGFGS